MDRSAGQVCQTSTRRKFIKCSIVFLHKSKSTLVAHVPAILIPSPCDRKSAGPKEEDEEMEDGIKEEVKKTESDDEDEDEPNRSRKDGEEVQVRDVQYKLENLDFPKCNFVEFGFQCQFLYVMIKRPHVPRPAEERSELERAAAEDQTYHLGF